MFNIADELNKCKNNYERKILVNDHIENLYKNQMISDIKNLGYYDVDFDNENIIKFISKNKKNGRKERKRLIRSFFD